MLLALAILNAECRIACLSQYDTGEYRDHKCACIKFYDYELATQKTVPKRLSTPVEKPVNREEDEW